MLRPIKQTTTLICVCLTLLLSSACSVHKSEFKHAKKNIPLTSIPESVALIRFDYVYDIPSTLDVFEDNQFMDVEDTEVDFFDDSVGDDIDKAFKVINLYDRVLDVYERTENLRGLSKQDWARIDTMAAAHPDEFDIETITSEQIATILQEDFDNVFGLLNQHVLTPNRIPLLALDAAKGTAPYDKMGYPLGEILSHSIPSSAKAGLAAAIFIESVNEGSMRSGKTAKHTWKPKLSLYVEMIDKQGNVLWAKKAERLSKIPFVNYYKYNNQTKLLELSRSAGPDINYELKELMLAFNAQQ